MWASLHKHPSSKFWRALVMDRGPKRNLPQSVRLLHLLRTDTQGKCRIAILKFSSGCWRLSNLLCWLSFNWISSSFPLPLSCFLNCLLNREVLQEPMISRFEYVVQPWWRQCGNLIPFISTLFIFLLNFLSIVFRIFSRKCNTFVAIRTSASALSGFSHTFQTASSVPAEHL